MIRLAARKTLPQHHAHSYHGRLAPRLVVGSAVILAWCFLSAPLVAQGEEESSVERGTDRAAGQVPSAPEPDREEGTEQPIATLIDRITFRIPFPAEKGGGTATGSAGHLEYLRSDYVVATLGVEFRYRDMKIQGDRVEVDLSTKMLTAHGDVILDEGPRRLTGETLTFDLETKTGELTNAKAFVDPDLYFEGERIEKTGDDTYRVTKGIMTSCVGDSPAWSFRMSRAQVRVEGFARVRNTRFRVKKLPLLYLPYILYPAKSQRTSGFLFPNIGLSRLRGEVLGLAYFQTLGDSADTTFFVDLYGEEFFALGNEVRYRPTPSTEGIFEGYAIEDPIEDKVRWKLAWNHTSGNLPLGFRGVLRYQDFSDFNFFRDFERDFNRVSTRRLRSTGFLAGNWGQHSLTLLVDQNETFLNDSSVLTLRQLPEVEYRLRATQFGSLPIYLDLLSSLHYFSVERAEIVNETYGRADLLPQITASLSTLPWLSVSLTAGERATWYSKTVAVDEDGSGFADESLTRTVSSRRANIVGPSFSRVFDKKIGKFARFKHIIEPRFAYAFVDEFEDQALVPLFDQVDRVQPTNVFAYALVNRLLAKPKDEEEHGGAREILSFEINQRFSLDHEVPLQRLGGRQTTRGPMSARLRFNPGTNLRVESQVSYNTLVGRLNSTSLTTGLKFGRQGVGATWFTRFNAATGDTTGNQVRLFTAFELWPGRLKLDSQVNYDFQTRVLQSHRHIIQFFGQCFGLRLELRELQLTDRRDRDFRFALSLKNVGTFLDLTGGTRTGFNPGFR